MGTGECCICSDMAIWERCSHMTLSERPILYNYAPRITEWLKTCPSNSHIPETDPSDPKKKRKRTVKKKKDVGQASSKSPVAMPAQEDSFPSRPSSMSPELRSRHTPWNPAATVLKTTAVQIERGCPSKELKTDGN